MRNRSSQPSRCVTSMQKEVSIRQNSVVGVERGKEPYRPTTDGNGTTIWCADYQVVDCITVGVEDLKVLTNMISLDNRKREKLHFFDRTFHHLLFCQTPNFLNVLSKMLFCQNKANNVLSKFVKILSNSDGYLDSLLFCQSLQSCLTEQF